MPVRARDQAHIHRRGGSVGWSVHVRSARYCAGIHERIDPIIGRSTTAAVVILKIPVYLAEAKQIQEIMHEVAEEKQIHPQLVITCRASRVESHYRIDNASRCSAPGIQVRSNIVALGLIYRHPISSR